MEDRNDPFAEGYVPDYRGRVTDLPGGRFRIIEDVDFFSGDIHEAHDLQRPWIVDRAARATLIDLRPYAVGFHTAWNGSELEISKLPGRSDGVPPLQRVLIDPAGARFREASPD